MLVTVILSDSVTMVASSFSHDFIYEAGPLAIEIRGEDTPENRRWIYYQASKPTNIFGLFRIGRRIAGRRSRIHQVGLAPDPEVVTAAE